MATEDAPMGMIGGSTALAGVSNRETWSDWLAILSGIVLAAAYITYFQQTYGGASTPNPSAWMVSFAAGILNWLTYQKLAEKRMQLVTPAVLTALTGLITVYGWISKKDTDWQWYDIICTIVAIVLGIVWWYMLRKKRREFSEELSQLDERARRRKERDLAGEVNFLIQLVFLAAYWPTIHGILNGTAHEKSFAWSLAICGYVLFVVSIWCGPKGESKEPKKASEGKIRPWISRFAPYFFPIMNGIIGNGSVVGVIWWVTTH